jgi:hypothetical protein
MKNVKLFATVAAFAATWMLGVFMGDYTARCDEMPSHIHKGSIETKAADGHYLIHHMTGDIYEMSGGEWKLLEICE